jgi:hypothetical protein
VGAQYREARRARSFVEFISKINGAIQEADETGYWLERWVRSEIVPAKRLAELRQEIDELIAIFTASAKTAKNREPGPWFSIQRSSLAADVILHEPVLHRQPIVLGLHDVADGDNAGQPAVTEHR